jgi:hypothetical protein
MLSLMDVTQPASSMFAATMLSPISLGLCSLALVRRSLLLVVASASLR